MSLSATKSLFSIALFLVNTACTNTEDEAREALLALKEQYETASLWNFKPPRPGLMSEDDVDVALNAILEIRGELEAVVAKFPDTTAAKDILSNTVHTPMVCRSKKLMLKSNIYKVKRRCFSIAQRCFLIRKINQLVELLGLVFSKKATPHRKQNQLTCMVSGTSYRVYMTASSAISL